MSSPGQGRGQCPATGSSGHCKSFVFNLKNSGESSKDFKRREKHDLKFIFKDHTSCSAKSGSERDKRGGRTVTLDSSLELLEGSGVELPCGPRCHPQPRTPQQQKHMSTKTRGHKYSRQPYSQPPKGGNNSNVHQRMNE